MRGLGEVLEGAQRLLNAQGIDPTTDDGLVRLRDGAQQLEIEFGDPNSQTRQLLTQTLNGQLKSDVVRLRDGAAQLDSGARKLDAGLVKLADGGQAAGQRRRPVGGGHPEAQRRVPTAGRRA